MYLVQLKNSFLCLTDVLHLFKYFGDFNKSGSKVKSSKEIGITCSYVVQFNNTVVPKEEV